MKVGARGKEVDYVGYSAVLNCYHAMMPLVTTIKKRKPGSTDPNSSWARACMRFSKQLLIRFNMADHARPKRLESAYRREWTGCPSDARI